MGAVKQHFHDEICDRAARDDGYEPDILEMLAADAEIAIDRVRDELKRRAAEGQSTNGESHECSR